MVWDFHFNSEINNVQFIDSIIEDVCLACPKARPIKGNILISLLECVTNAIIHGNKRDHRKTVTLHLEADNDRLVAEVTDQGDGFDITKLPNPTSKENIEKPNGRGVFLMRNLTDEFTYDVDKRMCRLVYQFKAE